MIKQKKKGIIKIGIIFAIIFVAIAVFVSSRYITKNVYATSLNNNQQTITDSKDNNTSNNSEVKDRDTLKNDIENEEATETIKGMDKIVYTPLSEDLNASDAKEVQDRLESWNFTRADNKKIAYLTFDDGPSTTVTPQILDILKKNNIKATFFVLGSVVEESDGAKEVLKQMVKDGHAIGNHGYCHDYSKLYPNGVVDANAFINDMEKSEKILQSVLGADFHTRANWAEVGGEELEIKAFQRDATSGSQTLFVKLLMGDTPTMDAPTELRPGMMGALVDGLALYNNEGSAIGYSVYYYINEMYSRPGLRLLAVDGVTPSAASIADESYPLLNEFYVAIRADEPEDSPARQLRDWVLSESGCAAIEAAGYVPAAPGPTVCDGVPLTG